MNRNPYFNFIKNKYCSNSIFQRGVIFVEFAIVLPLLVFFLFGIAYFGLWMHDYVALNNITRNAVRYAAVETSGAKTEQGYTEEILDEKAIKIKSFINNTADSNLIIYKLDQEKLVNREDWLSASQTIVERDTVSIILVAKKIEECPVVIDDLLPGEIKSSLKMKLE